ncbi:MAG: hypothetical protein EXR50_07570 [Dehalococcoidia bacterium]|nr:hypothetical protein [Dehalococcoidia bacterium]
MKRGQKRASKGVGTYPQVKGASKGAKEPAPGHSPRLSKGTAKDIDSFYKDALTEAEQALLPGAMEMEGLDEEIALLRLKLQQAIMERPEDMDVLMKGVSLLVRAVATQYKLSPKAKDDLMDSVIGVLNGIGEALGLPEDAA